MQKIKLFTIDLTKIEGRGEVKCPRCGVEISPDDKTEDTYTVLQPTMKGNFLEKIVLQCNSCKSQIHLTGFHLLNNLK